MTLPTTVHGPARGPTLVLQHGVGSTRRFLGEAVVPPLVTDGWRVVAATVRGHDGASDVERPRDHALDLLAVDLAAVVAETDAVACGGVSIGAHAVVAAAARGLVPATTRVVAALPAWTGRATAGQGPHAAVAAEVREHGVAGMLARLRRERPAGPTWLRQVVLRDLAVHDGRSLAAAMLALDGASAPTTDDLAALAPGLGVVGWEGDPGHPLAVAARWARAAPGAVLVTLDLADLDHDPVALGRAVAAALGPP